MSRVRNDLASTHGRKKTYPVNQLLALLFTACTLITDRQGRHFQRHQLPDEAARSMVQACAELDPFVDTRYNRASLEPDPLVAAHRTCVSFLLVMGALESGWQLHVAGDHGKAHGPYQEWTYEPGTWLDASRHYLRTVGTALRVCPEQVIAPLAGERCGDSSVHAYRWGKILDIARAGE